MALQHLDGDSKEIIALANEIAHDDELEYVGTEHILLAILRLDKGVGARVLREYSIDEKRARQQLEEIVKREKEDTWVFGRLPGSPHFRNVMALAIDEATQLEAKSIGSEHLLLALLREKGSAAQRGLASMGLTLAICREKVLKLLGG